MALQLNPYLTFSGQAKEAMEFYADVLGCTLNVMTFRDAGTDIDGIMHAALETPTGFHLYASDQFEGMGPDLGWPRAARSSCRWSARCGATTTAWSPTSSGSPGTSTSPAAPLSSRAAQLRRR